MEQHRIVDVCDKIVAGPEELGKTQKKWYNIEDKKMLLKYAATLDNDIRGDFVAEVIAYDFAKLVGLNVPKVEFAKAHMKDNTEIIGTLNHHVCKNSYEGFLMPIQNYIYGDFKNKEYECKNAAEIKKCNNSILAYIEQFGMLDDFLLGMAFDIYVCNHDRNAGNWGFVIDKKNIDINICFIDNTILGSFNKCFISDLQGILKNRYYYDIWRNNFIIGGKSSFQLSEKDNTLYGLFETMLERYPDKMIDKMETVKNRLYQKNVIEVLDNYNEEWVSYGMRKLIIDVFEGRKEKIDNIMTNMNFIKDKDNFTSIQEEEPMIVQ